MSHRTMSTEGPIVIDLPLPPDCLSPNARVHWAQKAKATKATREMACLMARTKRPRKPFEKATVCLDFYLKRTRDVDGLVSLCKAVFDGLQDGGLYRNDSGIELGWVRRHKAKEHATNTPRVVFTIAALGESK